VQEEWREIPGFPMYEASNLGRVRSWKTMGVGNNISKKPRFIKGSSNEGYRQVTLRQNDCSVTRKVSVLVALAFRGPRPNGYHVAHEDGDPSNDKAENLSYKTPKDNTADRYRHGTIPFGEACNFSKLTESEVHEIRESTGPAKTLIDKFDVTVSVIIRIRNGTLWPHMPFTDKEKEALLIRDKFKNENMGTRKLSMNDAKQIRQLYNEGCDSYTTLAKRFAVANTTIKLIIKGRSYNQSRKPKSKYVIVDWLEYDHLLGTMSDRNLANVIGCSISCAMARRMKLGVNSVTLKDQINWSKYDHLLGELRDKDVAEIIGCSYRSVVNRRDRLGVKSWRKRRTERSKRASASESC